MITARHAAMTFLWALGLWLAPFAGDARAELTATANHGLIAMDFRYHGSTVSVRGVADRDADLVIKIASENEEQSLMTKGKVGGFLWMNTGTLAVGGVPNVYYLSSTRDLRSILSDAERVRYALGYDALERAALVAPAELAREKDRWFSEFVKYKEASHLYAAAVGRIERTKKDGKDAYYVLGDWPYQAPPGDYLVTVYAVRDGAVVETATSHVSVEQVGIVRSLSEMARKSGALYGAISIVTALAAGFGVGLIFRKGGGAH